MRCPKCLSDIDSATCQHCMTAWPSADYCDERHALYRAAASRWRKWTLANRRTSELERVRELLGGA